MALSRADQTEIYGLFHDRAALLILGVSFAVRLLLASTVGPGFDEAYYHVYSLHLAGGYFDHPPLVAITAGLGRWLTGWQHPVTLRFGAVLWFTVTLAGFYVLARALYGRYAGRYTLLLAHVAPYFLVGAGAFVIPDNALTAAWVWGLYVAWLIREEKLSRLPGFLLLGVLTGIGLLAKYHAVLLPGSLFFAALFDRKIRSWFFDWRLYLALPVAALVFSPCILWNAQNDWISFAEQFGKSGSGGVRLRFDLLGQALGGQLAYMTPWLLVALWAGSLKRRAHEVEDRWLLPFFLLPVVAFTLIGLTRTVLPHWTMPGYLAALVLSAGAFAGGVRSPRDRARSDSVHEAPDPGRVRSLAQRRSDTEEGSAHDTSGDTDADDSASQDHDWIPAYAGMREAKGHTSREERSPGGDSSPYEDHYSDKETHRRLPTWTIAGIALNLLLVLLVIVQTHSGLLPLPQKGDPTLDPFGWEQTIAWLDETGQLRDDDLIFVHKWFSGGEVTWADRNRHPVVNIGSELHMYAWWAPPSEHLGGEGVFITQGRYIRDKDVGPLLEARFERVQELYPPDWRRGDETVAMRVWRVEGFHTPPEVSYGPSAGE